MIGQRLSQARKSAGLSLRELAQRTGISHTAVDKFEKGALVPASAQLLAFAKVLGVRTEFFLRPLRVQITGIEYRKKAATPRGLLARIHGDVLDQAERWQELLDLYPNPPIQPFEVPLGLPAEVADAGQVEDLAEALRAAWALGLSPIPDLTDTMESNGIRVIATDADADAMLDGLTGRVDGTPLIVVGRHWPGDRQRFTLAHELGHLLLEGRVAPALIAQLQTESKRLAPIERLCHRFAGAFLLPRQAVRAHLGARRRALELNELLLLKGEFGLSMAACLFRARDVGVIDAAVHQRLMRLFSQRGWRRTEPGPACPAESTILFRQLVFRALGEDRIGESKAAELLAIPLAQFHHERKLEAAGETPDQ